MVFLFQNEKQGPSGEEINRKKHPYKLIKLTNELNMNNISPVQLAPSLSLAVYGGQGREPSSEARELTASGHCSFLSLFPYLKANNNKT